MLIIEFFSRGGQNEHIFKQVFHSKSNYHYNSVFVLPIGHLRAALFRFASKGHGIACFCQFQSWTGCLFGSISSVRKLAVFSDIQYFYAFLSYLMRHDHDLSVFRNSISAIHAPQMPMDLYRVCLR